MIEFEVHLEWSIRRGTRTLRPRHAQCLDVASLLKADHDKDLPNHVTVRVAFFPGSPEKKEFLQACKDKSGVGRIDYIYCHLRFEYLNRLETN